MDLPEIRTARLRLVIARPGLEEPMARFFAENFEGHLRPWSPPPPAEGFGADYWAKRLAAFEGEFAAGTSARWVMLASGASPEVVCTCNFTQIARGPFRACVLGYHVARRHEGRGLMFEALSATLGHAFRELRLHRVMANYRPENERSGRLLERLGFVREGYAREYLFIDRAWRDHVLTAKSNPGFDAAWLNGCAEAASELRRHCLDRLRGGELAAAERLLGAMDDVFGELVAIDAPDALTGGLRRTLDALRAVVERTRGDVTTAVVGHRLQRAILP